MKKFVSILLTLAMVATMIPVIAVGTFADTTNNTATTTTGKWTDEGNYDISWCKTLDEATAETVTVGDKHYHVKAWTNQEYVIDTPAKLAGFAYLSNLAGADCFKGDDFIITADLDLGAHEWVPIAQNGNSKFRGSLIGKKGNVEGASVTISNMTVNDDATAQTEAGLIGQFGGDWIKNIDLKNAKITAANFVVGSFVGWNNGNLGSGSNGQGGYENLSSDAEIVLTSYAEDRFDMVGGIVGCINGTNASNKAPIITDCVFTGTISAPGGDSVGGIIGMNQSDGNTVAISDCVVVSEKIEWGAHNIYVDKNEDHNSGCGGIAGNIYSNKTIDEVAYSLTNCYAAANIIVLKAPDGAKSKTPRNVGGIIGASCAQKKVIENCQFDGVISGIAASTGQVLGRYVGGESTIKNIVITGIAFRNEPNYSSSIAAKTFSYVGRNANDGLTVEHCYNALPSVTHHGATEAISAIAADTQFTGLDFENTWAKVEGSIYPILKIAVDYYKAENSPSIIKKGMDLSWLNLEQEKVEVTTAAQLDVVAMMIDAMPAQEEAFAKKLDIADALLNADLSGYSETAQKYIAEAMGIVTDATYDANKISVQFAQIALEANVNEEKPQFNGTYNIRIVAKVGDATMKNAYFEYSLTQDDTTKEAESAKITTCYKELIEVVNGEEKTISAGDGYFVVLLISNVSFADVQNNSLSIRAYATGADDAVYYSGSFTNITLKVPTASAAN